VSYTGWLIAGICFSAFCALFFSLHAAAFPVFSRVKLGEYLKKQGKERYAEGLVNHSESLMLASSLYRLFFNMAILVLLLAASAGEGGVLGVWDYLITVFAGLAIFLVFSLAVPYAMAKYAGERIISRTYRMMMIFEFLVRPVIYIIRIYDEVVKRLTGAMESTIEEQQEEFLTELEQQKLEGVVDEEEREMIENVLELSDTAVNEIMTPRTDIVALEVKSDFDSILALINERGHSRLPVYEENIDNIVGLVYAKDLLAEFGREDEKFDLRHKMRQAYFVPETKTIRLLLHDFQNQKLHIAIVLDEYGGTAGIVTIEDILEELVGEIVDEYEEPEPEQIQKIDENTVEVDARTYIDDLNDEFEWSLPEEEDYETIGGFVFSYLGYIPKTGEKFEYQDLDFTISSAKSRKIERIRIQKKDGEKNVH
jgi:CBS domain containing-hemolysin-like protein